MRPKNALAAGCAVCMIGAAATSQVLELSTGAGENLYGFEAKDIDGKRLLLEKYRGKVVLFVNVASRCGLTPQYDGLEALYSKYKDRGLAVLGFPCNQFGEQEPGAEPEIERFCSANYGVSFPMFSKIEVNGPNAHPVYKWLKRAAAEKGEIEWNFAKFLVGRDGAVIARYAPRIKPAELAKPIERALGAG